MNTQDAREEAINEICFELCPDGRNLTDLKNRLYMIMNRYEITTRTTEISVLQEDRNEYLLRVFLMAKKVKGCSERTLFFYEKSIRKIMETIGKTADDITADDIRVYIALRLHRDKVTKTTTGNEIRNLSSFFAWLYTEEIIRKNPMLRVDRIKQENAKKEALTEMEVEKIRYAVSNEREKMVVEVLLSTGCRVTELVNIMLHEIDGERVLIHGKGGKDRYVYLNAKAVVTIRAYLAERKDANPYLLPAGIHAADPRYKRCKPRKEFQNWWKDPEMIKEGHTDKGTIEAMMRKLAKRAGVKTANPHKFRRTCASMALRRGMPIEQVSKMLGHESVETTQIYLDLREEDLAIAHKKYVR